MKDCILQSHHISFLLYNNLLNTFSVISGLKIVGVYACLEYNTVIVYIEGKRQ